ncbi:hypothetical protein [Paenibacillus sp. 481]|uniref:hypothetical protein n=1 Tax=Paenibacillus sp. 481 TaxID=2835869 RepID=UPI001E42ED64|nr:hypothetical protein [Paenibacillus sp. 481]UHA73338.1 hypothetical protein KIK04_22660 [Paenibacillus sp. 481]
MKTASTVAITALSSILLLGSSMNLTAEAAPSRAANDITSKMATATATASTEGEKLAQEEKDRINKLLEQNPYDTYVLYVSNELKKVKEHVPTGSVSSSEVTVMGDQSPSFDTYEAYIKRASALKEAVPQQPTGLPEGYTLSKASIFRVITPKEIAAIKAEAKKLGKQVYSKPFKKTSIHILLTYTNGEDYIALSSYQHDENEKIDRGKSYRYKSAKDMQKERPNLKGQIAEVTYRNFVNWYMDGKSFQIETNSGNPLTKEDLIKLAKTAVKKQL